MNDAHIPTLVYEYTGIPAGGQKAVGQIKKRRDKHLCKRNSAEWLTTVADDDDDTLCRLHGECCIKIRVL
jgi:hypothetical protein